MVFIREKKIFLTGGKSLRTIFNTYYVIIIGAVFSIFSILILFFSLTIDNKMELLNDTLTGSTFVLILLLLTYWKFKFDHSFYLIFILSLASSYTAFFTSFAIKLINQYPSDSIYYVFIVGILVINILGFLLVLGYILNNYIVFPLNNAVADKNEVNKLLETQKNELSNFAHTMAHDLRSGLTNIKLYLDLLKENDPESEYIEKINQQLMNIDDLMNKSVKLADQGLIIGLKTQINFPKLIQNVAEITLNEKIELHMLNIPEYLYCDREKIFQVLKNILENVFIHSKPKSISIIMKKLENNYILQISNDGRAYEKTIKKQFNKELNTLNRSKPLGLGLIIIKRIITAHNWKIFITELNPPTLEIVIPKYDIKEN